MSSRYGSGILRTIRRRNQRRPDRGLELGMCQSGAPLVLPRPSGDPQHVLLSGATGAGKSVFQRAWAGEVSALDDVAVIGLDPKRTALGMWAPRFTFVAKSIASCTQALVWLWAENERRLDVMEAAGVDEWHPSLGGPFIVVFIDELVQVSSIDGTELAQFMVTPGQVIGSGSPASRSRTKELGQEMTAAKTKQRAQGLFLSYLARICRSSGIQIVAATQYPMSEVVDPQVRANLTLRVMLRVPSNEMVKVCLGDGQHDDITADSISHDERGGCWVAGLGARPVRARGYFVDTFAGRARAEQTAALRWPLESVFVGQAGVTDHDVLGAPDPAELDEPVEASALMVGPETTPIVQAPVPGSVPLFAAWSTP